MRVIGQSLVTSLLLAGCASIPERHAVAPVVRAAPLAQTTPTQLPRVARPSHYAITVTPDLSKQTFAGTSRTDLTILETTNAIVMNAANLAITEATLLPAAGGTAAPLRITLDEQAQTVSFQSAEPIAPGRYTLSTTYSGTINTQANGLFSLDYIGKQDGSKKRALFTQFEAPDARRFAPMFDEPSYKTTFDLSAVVPANQMAVSNMPAKREEMLGDGRKRVTFATTPKMSSYLLFFGLGDFERIAMPAAPGVEVGIVSPTGSGEQARFALESLAPLITYYNDYFGQDFPMPKLDNIVGPGQSQFFGAMENWGAIFTFERILLVDPAITSAGARARIYETQAHETAHQWFGNLVTMGWWDDLWLNEGFASWMATKTTHRFHPEWHPLLNRVDGREAAMELDAFATTHPVVQEIKTVEQTNQAFDAITYQKGEAVIAMLEAYAGEDVWREGLRRYMAANKFGNARTEDLWQSVERAGARDLTGIARDFTTQPGIPLVKVASASCANGQTSVSVAQAEYSRDRSEQVAATPQRWRIPVLASVVGGAAQREVMAAASAVLTLPGCGPVIVNAGQLGYYRTLYPAAMLADLAKAMPALSPIDQLGLLRDQMALSGGAYQPYAPALGLLTAVPADANPLVAGQAVQTYEAMFDLLKDAPATRARLSRLASAKWTPRLRGLGFAPRAGEPLVDDALRASLISSLGAMGAPTVIAEARRLFAQLQANPQTLDGPLKTTWLDLIARNATNAEWKQLLALARSTRGSVERANYYSLLGRTSDRDLAQRTLSLALTDEPGLTTSAAMIASVAERNADQAVMFYLDNRDRVDALVDTSGRSAYLARLAGGIDDPTVIARVEALAKAMSSDEAKPLLRTFGTMRERARSRPRAVAEIEAWVEQA